MKQKMAEEREAAIAKAKQIREAKQAAAEARSAALAEAERLAGLARPLQRRTRRWPHRWKVNHLSFLSFIDLPQFVSFSAAILAAVLLFFVLSSRASVTHVMCYFCDHR